MKGISLNTHMALEREHHRQNRDIRRHRLSRLYWECTVRCNQSCRHCGSRCRVIDGVNDMPLGDFLTMLSGVMLQQEPADIFVVLAGGEPLMRPDIVECGRRIGEMGFPWGIETNGTLLSADLLAKLRAAGLRSVLIRLDGPEHEHNWLHNSPDAFAHTMQALKAACAEEELEVEVETCVNQRNFDYLQPFYVQLQTLHIDRWTISTVTPSGLTADNKEMQLDSYQLRLLMQFITDIRQRAASADDEAGMKVGFSCEGFVGKYEGKVRDGFFTCQAGISKGGVNIAGEIGGCLNIRHNYSQGNIYEGDEFMDVWNTCFAEYRNHRWMRTGVCTHCKAFRYCRGNGLHLRDTKGNLMLCHYYRL